MSLKCQSNVAYDGVASIADVGINHTYILIIISVNICQKLLVVVVQTCGLERQFEVISLKMCTLVREIFIT